MDTVDAPIVAVNGSLVLVDGVLAGTTDGGDAAKLPVLFDMLRAKRVLFQELRPNRPFPGVCLFQIDGEVPAGVVKRLFWTAALAGYPHVSFLVRHMVWSQRPI